MRTERWRAKAWLPVALCVAAACMPLALAACSPHASPDAKEAEKKSRAMWTRIGAELAAAAQRPPGNPAILLVREASQPGFGPGQDLMEAAVRNGLSHTLKFPPRITVVRVPTAPVPEFIRWDSLPPAGLTANWLTAALQQHAPASLVISLVGEPVGAPPEGTPWPPIICFAGNGSTNLARLIRSGVVTAAVAPRHTNPNPGAEDWFDLRYTVLNKDSIAAW
jgi:hypothetical protein